MRTVPVLQFETDRAEATRSIAADLVLKSISSMQDLK